MKATARIASTFALIAMLAAMFTAPASASEGIESFSSALSTARWPAVIRILKLNSGSPNPASKRLPGMSPSKPPRAYSAIRARSTFARPWTLG